MNEASGLLAIGVLLYLSECVVAAPRDAWIFEWAWGRGYRGRDLESAFGTQRTAFHLVHPLAAWVPSFVARRPPAPSESQREGQIRARMRATHDLDRIAERVRATTQATRTLRVASATLFAFVFVVLPVAFFVPSLRQAIATGPLVIAALATILVLHAVCVWMFAHSAAKAPGVSRSERWRVALSPFMSMRAPDLLARHALSELDPIAVAVALGDLRTAELLIARALSPWRYEAAADVARGQTTDPTLPQAIGLERRVHVAFLEEWVRGAGLGALARLRQPPIDDDTTVAYCPRCFTPYARSAGECDTCAIALVPFDAAIERERRERHRAIDRARARAARANEPSQLTRSQRARMLGSSASRRTRR